jgi:hypothetical protein
MAVYISYVCAIPTSSSSSSTPSRCSCNGMSTTYLSETPLPWSVKIVDLLLSYDANPLKGCSVFGKGQIEWIVLVYSESEVGSMGILKIWGPAVCQPPKWWIAWNRVRISHKSGTLSFKSDNRPRFHNKNTLINLTVNEYVNDTFHRTLRFRIRYWRYHWYL